MSLVRVTVTRRGALAGGRGPDDETVVLPDGATTTDLLGTCGVDPRSCVVVVNGTVAPRGTALRDGDRAQLYSAQAGG